MTYIRDDRTSRNLKEMFKDKGGFNTTGRIWLNFIRLVMSRKQTTTARMTGVFLCPEMRFMLVFFEMYSEVRSFLKHCRSKCSECEHTTLHIISLIDSTQEKFFGRFKERLYITIFHDVIMIPT